MKRRLEIVFVACTILVCVICFAVRLNYRPVSEFLDIQQRPPDIPPSIAYTEEYKDLSPDLNEEDLSESGVLELPGVGSVITMAQTDSGELMAMYSDGLLRTWDLDSGKVIKEFDFSVADKRSTNFTTDGSLVMTPGEIVPEGIYGYIIWDTNTGEQVYCDSARCSTNDAAGVSARNLLAPGGEWVMEYGETALHAVWYRTGERRASIVSLTAPDEIVVPHLSLIASDPSGTYIAFALREGMIEIHEVEGYFRGISPRTGKTYGTFIPGRNLETVALAFDYTNTWLAWLNNKRLVVWDLRNTVGFVQISRSMDNGRVLAFDRTGKLLVVGTDEGILVFDLVRGKKIMESPVGEVTALYFSRDNRLLIWGDAQGTIHLWGVPQE